ncbi:MAG: hypothetical protein F6K09_18855 [Merismopedia sp. SIO2A8]|nr:hypothetical protein [Merismopedia sp. SIO2A8]
MNIPSVDIPGVGIPSIDIARSLPHKKTPQGKTRVLHANYTRNRAGEQVAAELEHLRFFAQVAQSLGLQLEILTPVNSQEDVETLLTSGDYRGLNYQVIVSPNPISKWAEDSVEYLENGDLAILTPIDDDRLEWAMKEGRRQRWRSMVPADLLEAVLNEDHLWIPLGIRVNSSDTGQERERVAQDQGLNIGYLRAYIEGGNMITGEDAAGNSMVLVGKDAIATTAHLYQLTDDEVRQIIAEDFGLSNSNPIIAVEQPGQFHLDMGLLFLGNGVVVLNDSNQGLQDAIEMAELAPCATTQAMAAKLQLQCALETAAAQDLQFAGLTVIRQSLENNVMYNFFNGEFVEDNDGHAYYITNGGPSDQQNAFRTLMVNDWQVVQDVFFSPSQAAYKSLQDRGGVGCRLKGSR